jgi:cytidylate kinase
MPVIAMTAEMGSLREEVALEVAQALKLKVMRHEVVQHVAERMKVHHSLISRHRVGKSGFFERIGIDEESIEVYTAEELFELANQGNIILIGWGATYMLRSIPHVACVRICRPFEDRVQWLMEQLETDDQELAEEEIRRSDDAKAAAIRERFGFDWGDPLVYDLVLNTRRMSVETCAEQIKLLVSRPEFQETPESKASLANAALEAHVRAALKSDPATSDVNVSIEANNGRITLLGITLNNEDRQEAERVAAQVQGVTGVENKLKVMAKSTRFTSAKW